jgi:predicted HicB family RNase H-like nuclease
MPQTGVRTIQIPRDVHRDIKLEAVRQEKTISDLIAEILRKYVTSNA